MVAAILGEPWCRSMAEVARLTPRQIYALYLHPRDEYGRVKLPEKIDPHFGSHLKLEGEEEARLFFRAWVDFAGRDRAAAEAKWSESGRAVPTGDWYEALWR